MTALNSMNWALQFLNLLLTKNFLAKKINTGFKWSVFFSCRENILRVEKILKITEFILKTESKL